MNLYKKKLLGKFCIKSKIFALRKFCFDLLPPYSSRVLDLPFSNIYSKDLEDQEVREGLGHKP